MKRLFTLVLALVMSVCTLSLFACEKTESQTDSPVIDTDGGSGSHKGGATAITEKVYVSLGAVTTFSSETENYLERAINAEVVPANATNQAVDYSIEWASDATLKNNAVTDYVEIIPDADGALSAKVRCYQSFGDDRIIITCTTRDGGKKATCNVTYSGLATEMTVTPSAGLSLSNTAGRGDYYELFAGSDYSFTVSLKDVFGNVVSPDSVTVEEDVFGGTLICLEDIYITENNYIFTEEVINPANFNTGNRKTVKDIVTYHSNKNTPFMTTNYSNGTLSVSALKSIERSYKEDSNTSFSFNIDKSNINTAKNSNDFQSKKSFFNYTVSNPGSQGLMSATYAINNCTRISYYIPDGSSSYFLCGLDEDEDETKSLNANGFYVRTIPFINEVLDINNNVIATYNNVETIANAYFYFTITDTDSGLSQTIKYWIKTAVSDVSLTMANIIF